MVEDSQQTSSYENISKAEQSEGSDSRTMNQNQQLNGLCSEFNIEETGDDILGSAPPVKRKKRSKYLDIADKTCEVCGDAAKSMHFGGMACDSCKAFFRRSVQNDSYHTFKCSAQKTCAVIKDNRRICQYCRFQKCVNIGMEVRWVMSEAERMSLWKSKLSKHRKKNRVDGCDLDRGNQETCSNSEPSPLGSKVLGLPVMYKYSPTALKPNEMEAIEHLITLQELSFAAMPYPEECEGDTTASMANLFFCICQKLRTFFYRLDDFHEIPKIDQPLILRNGIAMSIYLHGAYNYDVGRKTWPAPFIKEALMIPNVTTETLRRFTVLPEMYDTLMDFYNEYGSELKDEAILVLLCLITLFHENNADLVSRAQIQNINNRYICLLRSYLVFREGEANGNQRLTKLLSSLFAVKKIVRFHKVIDIRHSVDAGKLIKKGDMSLRDQMIAVTLLLNQAVTSSIPTHSSAMSPDEKLDLLLQRKNKGLTFRRPITLPDPRPDIYCHLSFSSSLFGQSDITDRLLSFNHKNIISLKNDVRILNSLQPNISIADSDTKKSQVVRYRRVENRQLDFRACQQNMECVSEINPSRFSCTPKDKNGEETQSTIRKDFAYWSAEANYQRNSDGSCTIIPDLTYNKTDIPYLMRLTSN